MSRPEERPVYEFGEFRLDPKARRMCSPDGRTIVLPDRSFDALVYLVERSGRLVEKAELMAALWPGMIVEENNLNQTISRVRRALGDDAQSPRFIATVTRRGYQFIGEVHQAAPQRAGGTSPPAAGPRNQATDDKTGGAEREVVKDVVTPPSGGRSTARARPAGFGAAGAASYLVTAIVLATVAVAAYRFAGGDDSAAPEAPATRGAAALSLAASELVSDFPGSHSQPALSPSGRMMAFASQASGASQIWIKSLTGSDPVQITDGDGLARWPSWSPRDDSILFERTAPDGERSIWSVGAFAPREPRLVIERGAMPSFSWDGGSFVYVVADEVWIADADGGNRRRIEGVPRGPGLAPPAPSLSPDGALVAFIHADLGPYGDIWLVPAAGGEARRLTFHGFGIDSAYSGAPAWTPDGRFLGRRGGPQFLVGLG
jgi:DNA-binding winged helix-turn-helix (wHTH) protein